ncbi:hypothetical protein Neut_0256 [Nitrosomonas eutropha C91]|uniref:Uncharacterized protein n=1 Tax=Nitrosomonas eutropha (strain DSM 101675 / C91 / Nm57) TaxID=335283 RepID=Q0AJD1_NITEC|nr:hypothetical protein Neut_0256 [Nitrosomonas eutropha C91]
MVEAIGYFASRQHLQQARFAYNCRRHTVRMHTGCPWRDLPKAFDWKPATRCQKDTDATWTKKPGKSHFGYKLSINVDNKCKIIHRIETDTAPHARQDHAGHNQDARNDPVHHRITCRQVINCLFPKYQSHIGLV